MLDRILIVALLFVAGYIAYQTFSRYHVRRTAASASTDPILRGLQPGVPTIVYFTTPTCIPCRTRQQPALARLNAELGDSVQIVQIDATQDTEAADRWGVFSAPTTFILDGQRQVREVNYGVADAAKLKRQLEAARTGREREAAA